MQYSAPAGCYHPAAKQADDNIRLGAKIPLLLYPLQGESLSPAFGRIFDLILSLRGEEHSSVVTVYPSACPDAQTGLSGGKRLLASSGRALWLALTGRELTPYRKKSRLMRSEASRVLKLRPQGHVMPGLGRHPVEVGCPADVVS